MAKSAQILSYNSLSAAIHLYYMIRTLKFVLFSLKKVPQPLMRNLKKLTKGRILKGPELVTAEPRPWKEWFNCKMEDIYEKIRQTELLDWTNLRICRQEFLTNRLLVITIKNAIVTAKWKWSTSMMKLKNVFCLAKKQLYNWLIIKKIIKIIIIGYISLFSPT